MNRDEIIPSREQVLQYFRSDTFIEDMNDCDKEEIGFACFSRSDYICTLLRIVLDIESRSEEKMQLTKNCDFLKKYLP